jgi:transposase
MARGDLTDQAWEAIEPLLPRNDGRRGGRFREHRTVLNGILWVMRTGAPWRDLPERYGPWQTSYDRLQRWQRDGTWQRVLQALQGVADAGRLSGQAVEWDGCALDSTSIKAHPHAAGARRAPAKKGARGLARQPVRRHLIRRKGPQSPGGKGWDAAEAG